MSRRRNPLIRRGFSHQLRSDRGGLNFGFKLPLCQTQPAETDCTLADLKPIAGSPWESTGVESLDHPRRQVLPKWKASTVVQISDSALRLKPEPNQHSRFRATAVVQLFTQFRCSRLLALQSRHRHGSTRMPKIRCGHSLATCLHPNKTSPRRQNGKQCESLTVSFAGKESKPNATRPPKSNSSCGLFASCVKSRLSSHVSIEATSGICNITETAVSCL